MFADKLVVGFILIEGVDDVIAEAPGIGKDEGAAATARLGEAGDVEPMAAPALAEFGAGEEVINNRFKSAVRCVIKKGFHLLW